MKQSSLNKKSSSLKNLSLVDAYKVHARLPIIQSSLKEYPIIKKYYDNKQEFKPVSEQDKLKSKKRALRLRTYLDEEQIKFKQNPGPGTYNLNINWIKEGISMKNLSDRKTYLDQVIRKNQRNKSPGPGQHQSILQNYDKSASKLNYNQQKKKQRLFYYDEGQYVAATTPAVGQYNVNKRIKTEFRRDFSNPKQNIQKDRTVSEKKLKKMTKMPDMGTYNPQECSYFTFSAAKKVKPSKNSFGIGQRFKTLPQKIDTSPAKYNVINQWKGKNNKTKKYEKHGLQILSKPQMRVYY